MSKSITTGIFGSVVGIVTTIIGILWILQYYTFEGMSSSTILIQNLTIVRPNLFLIAFFGGFFQSIAVRGALSSFLVLTTILSLLLFLTLILTGIGLYGLGKVEDKAMGIGSLVVGVIGAIIASILLLLSELLSISNVTTDISLFVTENPYLVPYYPYLVPYNPYLVSYMAYVLAAGVPTIDTFFLRLGLIVVGVTLIIFGVTFINVREGLDSPGLSVATGVLFIIAGIFLFAGMIAPWLAFIILFVTLIMAALIFFQSR